VFHPQEEDAREEGKDDMLELDLDDKEVVQLARVLAIAVVFSHKSYNPSARRFS
jgi:hypothetical protein